MSSKLQMFVLKKIYELRSEALLTPIFVKLSVAIFCLQKIYLWRHYRRQLPFAPEN